MLNFAILLVLIAVPIQDEPKPVLSKDPLTAEQIAVYRAVLMRYTGGGDTALNIANVTDPFGAGSEFTGGCPKEDAAPPPAIHRLDPAIALNSKMVLVDPHKQKEMIEKNDPQNLLTTSTKDHEPVSDKDLDKSVQTAFATGLFRFSEIVFNKQHTRAVLEYGFVCGWLCGHGNTVILKKVRGRWKVRKTCSSWIA
jgi:hypothetical protein